MLSPNFAERDTVFEEGDIDGDGQVTVRDFEILSRELGRARNEPIVGASYQFAEKLASSICVDARVLRPNAANSACKMTRVLRRFVYTASGN